MIPPETIAEVRERTDIVAVLAESIPSLKRNGRRFVGLCPFHKEKTPSFNVNPDSGFYHCFGCKESGSVIDFVMRQEGLTFPEAVRSLAERLGIEVKDERAPQPEDVRRRQQKDDLYAVNAAVAAFFETQLREHPERGVALDELARRDLLPSWARGSGEAPRSSVDEALQAFRIGYAPARWDALVPYLRAQGISPVQAVTLGLLVERSSGGHFDRFYNRLMFAVVDVQGRVVGFSGRLLPDPPGVPSRKTDQKPAKYINSPESPIYTKGNTLFGLHQARSSIRQEDQAIVVEGNFDVVSLHARGLTNVVAPLGTAFTPEQAKLVTRFTKNVVFLFDGDAAGKKAARASREPSRAAGLSAKVAVLPDGIDPDELARKSGIASVREVAGRARGMLEYLVECALDGTFSSADAHERAARVSEVGRLLAEEDDPLVRSMVKAYADKLAGRLDLVRSPEAFRALEASVRKAVAVAEPPGPRGPDRRSARVTGRTPGSAERKAIVGALIEYPSLVEDPEISEILDLLEGLSAQVVVGLVRAWTVPSRRSSVENDGQRSGREEGAPHTQVGEMRPETSAVGEKRLDVSLFLAQIPETIHPFASERLAAPTHDSLENAKKAVFDNAQKLRRTLGSQETTDFAREGEKVVGNWEAEIEIAREAAHRERLRRGIK
ncbi:MAG: DNA primase [Polyangiaceae bacterium]